MDDIEAIKRLKARYFRTMDTKDWTGMRESFVADAVIDLSEAGGGEPITGADTFISFLKETIGDHNTVHHAHMPEIELTSETTATGIWALEDLIRWTDGSELHGYGHYHEVYRKIDGVWRIESLRVTRLRLDLTPGTAP